MNEKWKVTFNDGSKVVLIRDTDEAREEAELHRPKETNEETWLSLWPVGRTITPDDFHIEVKRAFSILPPSIHEQISLREYAQSLYLTYSSRDKNIAHEYFAAISGGDAALQMFCERYSDPAPDHVIEFESGPAREGLAKLESRK